MSQYVGIPIRIPTYDDKGDAVGYELAVFATVIRNPSLSEYLKQISKKDAEEDAAIVKASISRRKLMSAETEAEVDSCTEAVISALDKATSATMALNEAIRAFVVKGFTLAGYTEEQAQRYTDMIGYDRIRELKSASMVGSGRLDFTKATTAA
jgi:hypothetical protein